MGDVVARCQSAHPATVHDGMDVGYLDAAAILAVGSSGLKLENHDDQGYGYLRAAADAAQLMIEYHQAGARSASNPASTR